MAEEEEPIEEPEEDNGDRVEAKPEEQKDKARKLLIEKKIVNWDLSEDHPEVAEISDETGLSPREVIGLASWLRSSAGKEWATNHMSGAPQAPSGEKQPQPIPPQAPSGEKQPQPTQLQAPSEKPKMAEEEWLPEAYHRLDGILTQMRGVRGLSSGRVETIKELVKNNPEMYMNPQGLTQLLQGIQVNPFQIPLIVTHTFGGATPQFQPVVYPQQQNMPQFIPQQQQFMPQYTPQQQLHPQQYPPQQGQGHMGATTSHGLSKDEVMEIIKAQNKDRELEEAKRLAQNKDRELEEIKKKLEATEKGSGTHSSEKELEAIRKKLEAFEKSGGAPNKEPGGGLSEERLIEILNGRDMKSKENTDKNALIQTLDGIRQGLDNLHGRVSTIEQSGVPGKHSEGEDAVWNKRILNAAGTRLVNLFEKGELTEDRIRSIVKESSPRPSAPPGTRSEYDMRVEQAQHEAEARKVEAMEHRKGFEAIAGGIRDGFQGLGFNVGAGLSAGPAGVTPAPTQPRTMAPSEPQLPIRGADGQLYVECPHCHVSLTIPEGQARVVCPSCGGIVNIRTREEATRGNEIREVKKKPRSKKQAKKPEVEKKVEEKPTQEVEKTEGIPKTVEAQKTEKPEKPPNEKPEKPKEESDAEVAGKTEGSSN